MSFDAPGTEPWVWAVNTYEEIVEVAGGDGSVLVMPIASLEQHGPHLPTATDTILATAVADRGAELATEAGVPVVVLPPVWSGYSPHHTPFGGTVTLRFETMLAALGDIADSALGNGFDALLVLNGHGGNGPLVSSTVSTVGERHPDVDVLGLTYWLLAAAAFNDDLRESDVGGASHGGEFETSLMLALHPDLVREDRFRTEYYDQPYAMANQDLTVRGHLSSYRPWTFYSETGVGGDPTVASAETGEALFAVLGDALSDLLVEIHETNR
jgi:creatinine amidohydrolase